MTERLTAERLAEIRLAWKRAYPQCGHGDVFDLLAEVEHLQAELRTTQIEGGKYFASLQTAASRIVELKAEVARLTKERDDAVDRYNAESWERR